MVMVTVMMMIVLVIMVVMMIMVMIFLFTFVIDNTLNPGKIQAILAYSPKITDACSSETEYIFVNDKICY
jgi:hypothetical protein